MVDVKKCIYCGRFFNASKGEGDYTFAAGVLGVFAGDNRFRGVCRRCNNSFGVNEQVMAQSSPLGLFRAELGFKVRSRGSGHDIRPRGKSKGGFARIATATLTGWNRLVSPAMDGSRNAFPVDQLVIRGPDDQEHFIRLFPNMTAKGLATAVQRTGVKDIRTANFNCSDVNADRLLPVIKKVFPNMTFSEAPDTEPGVHRVLVRTTFRVGVEYFQGLAKIAFHHYLIHNQRGYKGSEEIFRGIRTFIRHGGDIDAFFPETGDTFGSPIGTEVEGGRLTVGVWCHIVLVDEREFTSRTCMWLFAGPENVPRPIHVTLASDSRRILLPAGIWGHAYEYDRSRTDKYAGTVRTIPTIRVQ